MMLGYAEASDGKKLFLLGLSRENVSRLQKEPIHLTRETHGNGVPADWEIVIIFGETEIELMRKLQESGKVTTETKINIDPRL